MTAGVTVLRNATGEAVRWAVVCEDRDCTRPLSTSVATELHARNLAAKHDREYHPDEPTAPVPGEDPAPVASYDLSAAARVYLNAEDTDKGTAIMWLSLTGLRGQAARDLAEQLAAHPTTAHTAPF